MTKLHMAVVALALAAVAVPVALRAQTEPAAAPAALAAVSPIDFTVAADEKAGGDFYHSGGKHFTSQTDPEWQTLKAFVMGQTLGGSK